MAAFINFVTEAQGGVISDLFHYSASHIYSVSMNDSPKLRAVPYAVVNTGKHVRPACSKEALCDGRDDLLEHTERGAARHLK